MKDSRHANMKELRFDAQDGVWRVAFAFDPKRRAILLIAGDKSGGSERRFYRELIRRADGRFDAHLDERPAGVAPQEDRGACRFADRRGNDAAGNAQGA